MQPPEIDAKMPRPIDMESCCLFASCTTESLSTSSENNPCNESNANAIEDWDASPEASEGLPMNTRSQNNGGKRRRSHGTCGVDIPNRYHNLSSRSREHRIELPQRRRIHGLHEHDGPVFQQLNCTPGAWNEKRWNRRPLYTRRSIDEPICHPTEQSNGTCTCTRGVFCPMKWHQNRPTQNRGHLRRPIQHPAPVRYGRHTRLPKLPNRIDVERVINYDSSRPQQHFIHVANQLTRKLYRCAVSLGLSPWFTRLSSTRDPLNISYAPPSSFWLL